MADNFDDFISDLIENPEPIATKRSTTAQTFPCGQCAGTGVYRGPRRHQEKSHCFACKGLGYFKTDPRKLQENRVKAAQRKAAKSQAAADAFEEANPGLRAFLRGASEWSSFAASLLEGLNRYGSLTPKQLGAAQSMRGKCEARKAAKAEAREERIAAAPTADAARIREIFENALANGKKRRALHAGHFSETETDDRGRPALLNKVVMTPARPPRTEIWIKVDDEFCGGIKADGKLDIRRNAPAWLSETVIAIAADPDSQCRLYGMRTGVCSCCGRELTNAVSIELGIGPICRKNWGLV